MTTIHSNHMRQQFGVEDNVSSYHMAKNVGKPLLVKKLIFQLGQPTVVTSGDWNDSTIHNKKINNSPKLPKKYLNKMS